MCAHTCAQAWHKGNVVRERKREREREFHHFLPRRYDKQVTLKRTDSTKSYLKLEKLVSTI